MISLGIEAAIKLEWASEGARATRQEGGNRCGYKYRSNRAGIKVDRLTEGGGPTQYRSAGVDGAVKVIDLSAGLE